MRRKKSTICVLSFLVGEKLTTKFNSIYLFTLFKAAQKNKSNPFMRTCVHAELKIKVRTFQVFMKWLFFEFVQKKNSACFFFNDRRIVLKYTFEIDFSGIFCNTMAYLKFILHNCSNVFYQKHFQWWLEHGHLTFTAELWDSTLYCLIGSCTWSMRSYFLSFQTLKYSCKFVGLSGVSRFSSLQSFFDPIQNVEPRLGLAVEKSL